MDMPDPESQPSVLLAFRAENARSFKDETELSLLATAMAEKPYVRGVPWREGGSPVRVLPAAGAFGANGSGKSNLLTRYLDGWYGAKPIISSTEFEAAVDAVLSAAESP